MVGCTFRRLISATGTSLALQECLYSFIMAFIFITAAKLGLMTFESKTDYALVTAGMVLTWGVIDALMLYWLNVYDQRESIGLMRKVRNMPEEQAVDALVDAFSGTPLDVIDEEDERKICREMLGKRIEDMEQIRADRERMMLSSVGCVVICALTLIPLVIPILFFEDLNTGLDAASFISSTLLFFVGFYLGRNIGVNGWVLGISLAGVTWAVSLISTFTGG